MQSPPHISTSSLTTDHWPLTTVLVTGATGFVGSRLCRALAGAGYTVRALHRRASSLRGLEGLPVQTLVGDILEPATLVPALAGVELVFHVAAQSDYWRHPQGVIRAAVEGTRNVVEAAAAVGARPAGLVGRVRGAGGGGGRARADR